MELNTVKVQDPNVEGSHIVINETDYNPNTHKLFKGKGAKTAKPSVPKPASPDDPFPESYRYEAEKGGDGRLYGPDDVLIEGPSAGKFPGRAAALEAALAHAAAHPTEGAAE